MPERVSLLETVDVNLVAGESGTKERDGIGLKNRNPSSSRRYLTRLCFG